MKMAKIISHQGNGNKNYNEISSYPHQNGNDQKDKKVNAGKNVEKNNSYTLLLGM